jgi:paraquat-inducible protein B
MNDSPPPGQTVAAPAERSELPEAELHAPARFQLIWLIPIVALLIAGYLGWQTYAQSGPEIVITFSTGDGISPGQTQVRHKAVPLGTVHGMSLSPGLNTVEVHIDMRSEAERMLTKNARFWVVRPRLTAGNISGLDTVLSGSYIEMDPGTPGGGYQTQFTGLEEPPAVRSGEPGSEFVLTADRIGSISPGAPIFYRDITAGEVLDYDLGPNGNGVTIHVFVRAPYDRFVHPDTKFWNASGVALDLGAEGVQLRISSLQALLAGGIAFDTLGGPESGRVTPDTKFRLYGDEDTARAAGYSKRLKFIVYFEGSVRGLSVGAPATLDGIQVGSVTAIHLLFPPTGEQVPRVAVQIEVQPERFLPPAAIHLKDTMRIASELVDRGLRAQLASANFLTGQMLIAFDFVPDAPAAHVSREGDAYVIPGIAGGGLDGITASLSRIAGKLEGLPLEQVASNLSAALHGVSTLLNGPDIRDTLQAVSGAARHLPSVAEHVDHTLTDADRLVASANAGYGRDSQFQRDLSRLMDQFGDAARSIRLLSDYLDAHPEALIRGRAGRALPP